MILHLVLSRVLYIALLVNANLADSYLPRLDNLPFSGIMESVGDRDSTAEDKHAENRVGFLGM